MKVSMNWLNEWIEVSDLDPRELAERLTMAGLEVDGLEFPGHGHDDIVVGEILSIEEHPKADRLVVCTVNVGESLASTIVCGAKNMKAGDRVPVALPGSNPPGIDFGIGSRKVMGVLSTGMLCSEEELGLAEESEGLMILDESLEVGTPIFDALKMRDVVLEIDLTPNRADCLSHYGIAREVAALYGRELRSERERLEAPEFSGDSFQGLEIVDLQGCPEYRMAVLEGIQIGPSPEWLQRRLAAVGQRGVNNVVDVTNFVLLDVGQPLHAFDLDKLAEERIVVRRAAPGEKIEAIDHNEYELTEADLVIADGEGPVAIAGVMGGAATEVSEGTTRILLECAYFDPTTVRKSAKRHGIHSESSHRFERGIDAGAVEANLWRAVSMLQKAQVDGGGSAPTVLSLGHEGRQGVESWEVRLDVERAVKILGVEISGEECRQFLEGIGLELVEEEEGSQLYRAPTFRGDLERPIDLIEELARLYGYEKIPVRIPRLTVGEEHRRRQGAGEEPVKETILARETRGSLRSIRSLLLDQGIGEAVNYSFMGRDDLDRLGFEEEDRRRRAPEVANPLVKTQELMRTTLIHSLLDNVGTNFAKRRFDVALFEIGRRYFEDEEVRTLGVVLTGEKIRHWSGTQRWDFFDLKGILEAIGKGFALEDPRWEVPEDLEPYLHPGVQARWEAGGKTLGVIGQIHPALAQAEGIEAPLFLAEIDLEVLLQAGRRRAQMAEPTRFPAVVRDFALLFERDRPYRELEGAITELSGKSEDFGSLFESMELFDVYEGAQVPEGMRSLAVKVTYRSRERTLTEPEVEAADRQFLSYLEEKTGARLR